MYKLSFTALPERGLTGLSAVLLLATWLASACSATDGADEFGSGLADPDTQLVDSAGVEDAAAADAGAEDATVADTTAADTTAADTNAADTTAADDATAAHDTTVADDTTASDDATAADDTTAFDDTTAANDTTVADDAMEPQDGGGEDDSGAGDAGGQPTPCFSSDDCPDVGGSPMTCDVGVCGVAGVCVPSPKGCAKVYAPECGCDDKTYGNACERLLAGVGKKSDGACGSGGGGDPACTPGGGQCAKGSEFCKTPDGQCSASGTCALIPQGCGAVFAPVCGCDGNTYSNACVAAGSSVSVAAKGECKAPPSSCKAGEVGACGAGMFCEIPKGGGCGDSGMCWKVPDLCPGVVDPVCGCDGKTYGNSCLAQQSGTDVDHKGPCGTDCKIGDDKACAVGYACFAKPDATTGLVSCFGYGLCETKPKACPDVYSPVCGCNGQTYGNACEAKAAGVTVEKTGKCPGGECTIGGKGVCGPDEVCVGPTGQCGGPGSCEPMPGGCLAVYDPVCGCDGKTHSNACTATMAGVTVAALGECNAGGGGGGGPGDICGGFAGAKCKIGYVCDWTPCGSSAGVCVNEPNDPCPKPISPVCGCDGKTYGGDCERLKAGVGKAYDGACAP